jgi:hypothetical protein
VSVPHEADGCVWGQNSSSQRFVQLALDYDVFVCELGGIAAWHGKLPVSDALKARIEALIAWHDDECAKQPGGVNEWWQDSFPGRALNDEAFAVAVALKAELPDDWTVMFFDAWAAFRELNPRGCNYEITPDVTTRLP